MIEVAHIELTDNEIDAAVAVLRSGALRQGEQCNSFEKEFANKTGAPFAISCSSGTAALHLAYMSFLAPGNEVLVPSFTFFATASTVALAGGKPIFCDVDPHTFLMDLEHAEQQITSSTRAIAPVHLFGNPCDVEAVQAFAKRHDLRIVWDAAQAHGARYRGRDIGSLGDFTCYSFYPTKHLFVGEGGMACTPNPSFETKVRSLRSHGETVKYRHTMLGLNYRMTDVEAAIGREQLKRLDSMLAVRRRNAERLNEGIRDISGLRPQRVTDGGEHAWHQYSVVVDVEEFGCGRDELATRLKAQGVATGIHYPCGLHQQPIFQEMYGTAHVPVTESLSQNILALPVHHGLTAASVLEVIKAIQSCRP